VQGCLLGGVGGDRPEGVGRGGRAAGRGDARPEGGRVARLLAKLGLVLCTLDLKWPGERSSFLVVSLHGWMHRWRGYTR
jgi:hypothetical protein